MELRQLRNFIKIVELGSLSRAAEVVYIAQSALSMQVASLESELGCQLLSRSSRGVAPTDEGMQLYRSARSVLQQVESMQQIGAGKGAKPHGRVTLGLPVSIAQILAVPLVQTLKHSYPDITLCIIEYPSSYLVELLLNRRLDLSMLFTGNPPRGLHSQPMLTEDFYAIGLTNVATSGTTLLSHFHNYPVVLPAHPNSLRSILDSSCSQAGIELKIVTECSNPLTMVDLVHAGHCATILPLSALPDQAGKDLHASLIEPRLSRNLALCSSIEAPQEPASLAVQEVLHNTVQELLSRGLWPGARPAALPEP